MSINQSELSKIYQDSQKTKINLQGKKFEEVRQTAIQDPEKFWSDQANNLLWNKKWDKTLDWNYPFAKWFVGGQLNASVNCLDRHIITDKKNKAAIIYQDEIGNKQTFTYNQLYKYVNKFASVLKDLGIKKGDRITIYLPMIPELIVSMLACSRLGAIHIVVFSGFSIQALSDRVNDSESRLIITSDYAIRRGKKIMLKNIVDDA
ncbi:MAG: AMP-binding protein, partial [Nitrososphaeraceae archaeon]